MSRKKQRGAVYAEGEQVFNFAPLAAERNGGYPPMGTVLRVTRRWGGWAYQVQVQDTDRIETWQEETLGRVQV